MIQFNTFIDRIFQCNPDAGVLPYPNRRVGSRSIIIEEDYKEVVKTTRNTWFYLLRFNPQQRRHLRICILIGLKRPSTSFTINMKNICSDHNIGNFKACVLQAPVTICIGWLLGINQNIDLNVFASTLNFLEFIVNLNTTVEVDVWPVKNTRVMPNWKDEQA